MPDELLAFRDGAKENEGNKREVIEPRTSNNEI